jgi:outer membrane protein
MKHFSTILNVVLLAAVGFLYYYVFAGKKTPMPAVKTVVGSNSVSQAGNAPIAYVEQDSLHEKIVFIKERRKELETAQKGIENQWTASMRGLEAEKNEFIKKGDAITQQMAEEFQAKLYQKQQKIEETKQQQVQSLSQKSYNYMEDIQKKLRDFLQEYNKDKKFLYILSSGTGLDYIAYKDSSLNITNDVIEGMNSKYQKGN